MTYKSHQATETTTVSSAHGTAELGLDQHLHDGHASTVDRILLVARRRTSSTVEQLRGLGHRHADQLRLRAAAASATSEALQDLEGDKR